MDPRNEPRYTILFFSKSPGKRIPSRFQMGSLWRDTRLQGIFTYLLIYLFISKALRKEHPSMFPKSRDPMETDAYSRALLNISYGVSGKGALPPGKPHGLSTTREAVEPKINARNSWWRNYADTILLSIIFHTSDWSPENYRHYRRITVRNGATKILTVLNFKLSLLTCTCDYYITPQWRNFKSQVIIPNSLLTLTLWHQNFLLNFSTPCI